MTHSMPLTPSKQKPSHHMGIIALAMVMLSFFMVDPALAAANPFPKVTNLACTIIDWMKGPLAVAIFMVVVVVTIVVGFFAKMDWTKILSVIVLYGILQGLTVFFNGFLSSSLDCSGIAAIIPKV